MNPILARAWNFVLWQRVAAEYIQFKALKRETFFLLTYAVLYIFSGYVIGVVILRFPVPILGATQFNQDLWYAILFKFILLLVIPSGIYFFYWKYTVKDLLLGIKPKIGNITATILMATTGFFLNATHLQGIRDHIGNIPDAPLRMTLGIMMPLFTAALPEELFFRGYLQTRLEKTWGRMMAILVSVILFTAWHLPSRYLLSKGIEGQAGNLSEVMLHTGLPVFIIGVIFAAHWSRYRNIVLLILTHWAVDILPSVSSFFKISF